MGGEQATFLQPSLGPITKIIVTEATFDDHLGNAQGQARRHKNTNDDL